MNLKNITVCLGVLMLVFACSKEETQTVVVPEVIELNHTEAEFDHFIAGDNDKSWETTAFTLAGGEQDCRLDDTFSFNSNKTYSYNGGDLCGAEDSQENKSGSWTINADENLIIFDEGTSNEFQAKITEVSNTAIKLEGSYMLLPIVANFSIQ